MQWKPVKTFTITMQLTLGELKTLVNLERLDNRKQNAYGFCPSCGQDEFGISLADNHRFGCFRKAKCGFTGNIFTLLAFLGKRIVDVKPGFEPRQRMENKLAIAEEVKIDLTLPDCTMPAGWKRINHIDYLQERGFEESDYERFIVGQTAIDPRFKNWTIFAIPQFGSIKGYVARNPKSKKELDQINKARKARGERPLLRYQNSSTDFSKMLLGIEEVTEKTTTGILVEGIFDKQNTDKKLGLATQDEVKCMCTFKCGVSDEQVFLLQESGISDIVLLYDPDVIDEIKKAAWKLDNYFNVYVAFNDEGADPGDMTDEDFDRVLSKLKTPSQFTTSKIDVPELKRK
jgi:hypothetical protein